MAAEVAYAEIWRMLVKNQKHYIQGSFMFNKQFFMGLLNITFPILLIYAFYPLLLQGTLNQIVVAMLTGAYLCYMSKLGALGLAKALLFKPTGTYKESFESMIQDCGVDPKTIELRYAYVAEQTAFASYNCLVIDPLIWQGLLDDPQALEIKNTFERYIEPTLTPVQKQCIQALHNQLTPSAQRFIFRHELSHIVSKCTVNRLRLLFFMSTVAVYIGLATGVALLTIHPLVALIVGMAVFSVTDILLTWTRNYFWQYNQEKSADLFAAQYSTVEEILAAADYFKKHGQILDTHKESGLAIPSTLKTGHPTAQDRVAYLMKLAAQKTV